MLKTTVLPKVTVSSDEVTRQRTEITLMSYDKNVHQIKIPTDLTASEINKVLVIFTFPFDVSVIQLNGAWVDGHIQFTLPDELRGCHGNVYVEIDVDLTDDRQITFARYRLQSVVSDIDKAAGGVQTFYFALFDELVTEVKVKRTDAIEEIVDEVNNAVLEIGEQIAKVDKAKTDAIEGIDTKVASVETTKSNAFEEINAKVSSVETAKSTAVQAIGEKQTAVEQSKTSSVTAINEKVATVETSKENAQTAISQKVVEVETAKTNAVTAVNQKVAAVEQTKSDALTTINSEKTTAVNAVNQAKTQAVENVQNAESNALTAVAQSAANIQLAEQSANNKLATINQHEQNASNAVTTIGNHLTNATAKNEAVNQKYEAFEETIAEANQNINSILDLTTNVEVLQNKATETTARLSDLENRSIKQYGVRRVLGATSPLLERIGDSVGLVANVPIDDSNVRNDFDNIYPWSHIKEVIIDNAGRVHYKDDPTYATAIGDWMIEVPLYYVKDVRTEIYHDEYVSAFKLPGYRVPKDFIREDGTICQKVYYARFKTGKDGETDVSRPGLKPSNYRGLASFRDGARAKGDSWQEIGINYAGDFLHKLFKIEFASLNSQSALGTGLTSVRYVATDTAVLAESATNRFVTTTVIANNFSVGSIVNIGTSLGGNQVASMREITAINAIDATQTEIIFDGAPVNITIGNIISMVAQKTGQTSQLQKPNGRLAGINGRTSVKWRGLEDPFGNLHEWVDGVLVMDNLGYLCDKPSKFANTLTVDYKPLGYTNVKAEGWPLEMGYDENFPEAKFPIVVGAGSTIGYTDYHYQQSGLRGAFFGGHASSGAHAGLFCWSLLNVPSYSYWPVGGRLLFKPPV